MRLEQHISDQEETALTEDNKEEDNRTCPQCSGSIIFIDLGIRKLLRCSNCGYKETLKTK